MTQCRYIHPPETFSFDHAPQPVHFVDVMGDGRAALVRANTELGSLMRLLFLSVEQFRLKLYKMVMYHICV